LNFLEKTRELLFADPKSHSTWKHVVQIFYKRKIISSLHSSYVYLSAGFALTFFTVTFISLLVSLLIYHEDVKSIIIELNTSFSYLTYILCETITQWIFIPSYIYFVLYARYQISIAPESKSHSDPFVGEIKLRYAVMNDKIGKKRMLCYICLYYLLAIFIIFNSASGLLFLKELFFNFIAEYDNSLFGVLFHIFFNSFMVMIQAYILFAATFQFLLLRRK